MQNLILEKENISDGYSVRELSEGLDKYYRGVLTSEDQKLIFYEMDRNSNGKIEFSELMTCFFLFCREKISAELIVIIWAKHLELSK